MCTPWGCGQRALDGAALSIEEELEVVSPAYFFGMPAKLTPILCDYLDSHHLDGPYTLRNIAVCHCKVSQARFCCPGFLHASVVLLLER